MSNKKYEAYRDLYSTVLARGTQFSCLSIFSFLGLLVSV